MLHVYSDGSAEPLRGRRGGWAFLLVRADVVIDAGSGGAHATTNNHMELRAALEGLTAALRHRADTEAIELVTDSRLTIDVALARDLPTRLEVESVALRDCFVAAGASARWVRAHSGQRWNEAVDRLAALARVALPSARRRRRKS
jgi:ribonuclease HI